MYDRDFINKAPDTVTGSPIEESLWSRLSRETVFMQESAAKGITETIKHLPDHAGEAVVAAGIGAAVSVPLFILSVEYPVIRPALDVLGIGLSLPFLADASNKFARMSNGVSDYWSHPEHKEEASMAVSDSVGPLLLDTIGAYGGFAAGMKYTGKFCMALEEARPQYMVMQEKMFPPKPVPPTPRPPGYKPPRRPSANPYEDPPGPEFMDDEEDAYWAERAKKAEKSGWVSDEEVARFVKKAKEMNEKAPD